MPHGGKACRLQPISARLRSWTWQDARKQARCELEKLHAQDHEEEMLPVRLGALSDVQLLTPQTLALEARQLESFRRWCARFLPGADVEALFATVPQFLPWALKSYAEFMFRNGGALSNYRHLVLAAQRWIPSSRVYMVPAWEMVERMGSFESRKPSDAHTRNTGDSDVCSSLALAMVQLGWCNSPRFLWCWAFGRDFEMFP